MTGGLAVIGGLYSLQGAGWVGEYLNGSQLNAGWDSWISTVDGLTGVTGAATIGMLIALLMWLHRTVRNAPALGAGTPPTSPGWAVGWWFVPVANLWKPHAILRDLWNRLVGTGHGRAWLVGTWWTTWVTAFLGARVIGAAIGSTVDVGDFQALLYWSAGTDVLAAIAAVAGLIMVREIQRAADQKAHALGLDAPAPSYSSAIPAVEQEAAARPPLTDSRTALATPTMAALSQPADSHGGPVTAPATATPATFCHQCGQRRVPGDRFCPSCGTELRG